MMRTLVGLIALTSIFPAAAAEVDFAHEVVPILKQHCAKCHGGSQKKGDFSINSRTSLLAGGESGQAVAVGKGKQSDLYQRITSRDDSLRMPPEGEPLSAVEVAVVARWIDEGAKWEAGFSFGVQAYNPPLAPRLPELPPASAGRTNSIDRILDAYLAKQHRQPPTRLDHGAFLRRTSLDLIGLLPTPEERE